MGRSRRSLGYSGKCPMMIINKAQIVEGFRSKTGSIRIEEVSACLSVIARTAIKRSSVRSLG